MVHRSSGGTPGAWSGRRRPRGFRPGCELLEGRELPSGGPATFAAGDVLVGVTGGVRWYRPDGTLVATVPLEPGQYTTGMAFDPAGNLLATGFDTNRIDRVTPAGLPVGTFGRSFDRNPTSIVFDAAGYAYVGQSDGSRRVLKFDPDGNLVDSYAVQLEDRGTGWVELAADQRTLYYTSEGRTVKRYDVVARRQLPDFATGLPGDDANQFQLLSDGGVLLADQQSILRLDAAGKVVRTYGQAPGNDWFSLVLDPDGTSFWAADYDSGDVVRIDITTGGVLRSFTADPGGAFGLAVVGGPRAATTAAPAISATAADAEVAPGQPASLTVRSSNSGPGTAARVRVAFVLPEGASFVTATSSRGGTPWVQGNIVAFALGDLAPGDSASVTLVLSPARPGPLTTHALLLTPSPIAPGSPTVVSLTTNVTAPPAPAPTPATAPFVISAALQLSGRWLTNVVVVHFSRPMDPARVLDPRFYGLENLSPPGRPRRVLIRRATYDPATRTAALFTWQLLNGRRAYRLTIAAGPAGLLGAAGTPLAAGPGRPGGEAVVELPAVATPAASRRR